MQKGCQWHAFRIMSVCKKRASDAFFVLFLCEQNTILNFRRLFDKGKRLIAEDVVQVSDGADLKQEDFPNF